MIPGRYLSFLLCLIIACNPAQIQKSTNELAVEIAELQQNSLESSADSSYVYLQQAAQLFPESSNAFDSLKAENNYLLGLHFNSEGNLDSAAYHYNYACGFVGDRILSNRQKDYFLNAFLTYMGQGKYGDCLSISEMFRSRLDETKDFKWLSIYYYFRVNVALKIKKYGEALAHNELRIKNLELANEDKKLAPAIITKAKLMFRYLNDRKGAFALLDELIAKEEQLTIDFKRQLYGNYGINLFYESEFKKAIDYYSRSLSFSKQLPSSPIQRTFLSTSYANITEAYLELKEYDKAQLYIDSVRAIGLNSINNDLQEDILQYQLQVSVATDKSMRLTINDLNDIVEFRNEEYLKKSNGELLALTKANKKEKVLLAEKQSAEIKFIKIRSRLLLLLVITTLLAFVGIFYFQQRRYKFEKQNLQLQQRLLRSQMNPHFTFNILYAIQRMIKKNQTAATTYLFTFSRLLRLILENSTHNYVLLNKELESLNKFLELQLFRFPDKFTYEIKLDNFEAEDMVFIPPMLLQPIVENCIDHGFSGIDYKGVIKITLNIENKFIQCKIEDNGKGLENIDQAHKKSTSTQLISTFLKNATGSKIELIDKKVIHPNQSGVIANFIIPYKNTAND